MPFSDIMNQSPDNAKPTVYRYIKCTKTKRKYYTRREKCLQNKRSALFACKEFLLL